MFEDYKEKVILAYQKKKEASSISNNLLHPTPGRLRNECLSIYKERCLQKDEKTFRLFFGPKDNLADYGQSINRVEIDKFRPLINFLKRKTNVTDERNIELLAWLIDFEPRPYQYGINYKEDITAGIAQEIINNSEKTENKDNSAPPDEENDETWNTKENDILEERVAIEENGPVKPEIQTAFEKFDRPKESLLGSRIKKTIASFMIIIVAVSSGTYVLLRDQNQACMYWTGDHYSPVSCNKKMDDTAIIALDTGKAVHFKKITQTDTLTQSAVGKVWYAKIDGEIEFYTADGFHPIYNDIRLKPITVYILNKYIHRK
jgi:hypothetical protein